MQLNPEQKRTFWTIVLTILKMIFFIGQKHVEKHVTSPDEEKEEPGEKVSE